MTALAVTTSMGTLSQAPMAPSAAAMAAAQAIVAHLPSCHHFWTLILLYKPPSTLLPEVFHGLQEQVMTTASRSRRFDDRLSHLANRSINRIFSVSTNTYMDLLIAGTKYRGEFEERLKKLMEKIKQSDEIILFIDEMHTLIGAGAAERLLMLLTY
ncbi:hypothetical protein HN51_035897 [Arachis hypogaea]